jgi:hypothetical protein
MKLFRKLWVYFFKRYKKPITREQLVKMLEEWNE